MSEHGKVSAISRRFSFYAEERADKAGNILLKCKQICIDRMQDLLTKRREIAV